MRVGTFPWPLMATELHGVSFRTGSIKTRTSGVSVHLEEASACRTAFNMSSGSYSGLAKQELVQRKKRKFITAPKVSSFRKAD